MLSTYLYQQVISLQNLFGLSNPAQQVQSEIMSAFKKNKKISGWRTNHLQDYFNFDYFGEINILFYSINNYYEYYEYYYYI